MSNTRVRLVSGLAAMVLGLAGAVVLPGTASAASGDRTYTCQTVGTATDSAVARLASLMGLSLQGIGASVGLLCNPGTTTSGWGHEICGFETQNGLLIVGKPGKCEGD